MKSCPGSVAVPLCLILAGVLLVLNSYGILHVHNIWSLWPVVLIATGMEKLYLWTITPGRQ